MGRVKLLPWRIWSVCVLIAGAVLLWFLRSGPSADAIRGTMIFGLLALAAEAMPVVLPRGESSTVSVSFAIIYSAILVLGPGAAAWVAALGTVRLKDLTGKVPLEVVLFNRAQLALSAGLAGLAFALAGGTPGALNLPRDALALFLCAVAYFIVNSCLVATGIGLHRGVSPVGIWIVNCRSLTLNFLALAPIGILMSIVYASIGWRGAVLFFLPLMIARYSFQRYMDMRNVYVKTIEALAAAIDAKDSYTKGHSERVAKYAVAIARELRLPEDQVEVIQYVALLHDIGKIGVSDQVLNKPSRLTVREYEEMKKHPLVSASIVCQIKILCRAVDIVRHHHERYDGRGYPDGLQGEQIPLGARILAVADAFDAMMSDRQYKRAFSLEHAVEELRACAGSHFDPRVVECFVRIAGKVIEAS